MKGSDIADVIREQVLLGRAADARISYGGPSVRARPPGLASTSPSSSMNSRPMRGNTARFRFRAAGS